jgi:hypothetical protein
MNGTALPSEIRFNHACRFRLGLIEQNFRFQTRKKLSRICVSHRKDNRETGDHFNAGGGGADLCDGAVTQQAPGPRERLGEE